MRVELSKWPCANAHGSPADANRKVIVPNAICPHNPTQHTQYAHMGTVTHLELSARPPLSFIWSGAVSAGSSRHNNPVSRLAVIASPAPAQQTMATLSDSRA